MVSSVTYAFLAACFVLTHQLPTTPVRPTQENHEEVKPYGTRTSEQHPVPSTFDKVSTDSSTRRTDQLQTSTGSSYSSNHRDNSNNYNNRQPSIHTSNPVEPPKPSAYPSHNSPSIKTVREASPIEAFKAHEASSTSSKTTESAKNSGSSSTTEASKKNNEQRPPSTWNKDSNIRDDSNVRISSVQKIPASPQHHAIKRDDTFAKIFVEDPYVLDFEPESSLIDGKKFRALPAFMG